MDKYNEGKIIDTYELNISFDQYMILTNALESMEEREHNVPYADPSVVSGIQDMLAQLDAR